ncbi:clarin-1 isoform X1 [Scophthalmus maximus]|uniref:clarin-1 isoform X1 n=1 Tax=Scophthalmus maximus TaxID=52904 RepID=UPI000F36CDDA|nr:clarin-1 isoform X1 [Scophthalmus maximus]
MIRRFEASLIKSLRSFRGGWWWGSCWEDDVSPSQLPSHHHAEPTEAAHLLHLRTPRPLVRPHGRGGHRTSVLARRDRAVPDRGRAGERHRTRAGQVPGRVFPDLLSSVPAGLHVSVIFLCGAVILFSSVATGFFFFNAFGRPYETLQGPMGLYLWTFICCVCSSLIMILFASEVKLHHLTDRIANFNEVNFVFQTYSERYGRSFWLFFLIFLLHGLNILLIRLAGIQFPFQETKESELSGGAADLMY